MTVCSPQIKLVYLFMLPLSLCCHVSKACSIITLLVRSKAYSMLW